MVHFQFHFQEVVSAEDLHYLKYFYFEKKPSVLKYIWMLHVLMECSLFRHVLHYHYHYHFHHHYLYFFPVGLKYFLQFLHLTVDIVFLSCCQYLHNHQSLYLINNYFFHINFSKPKLNRLITFHLHHFLHWVAIQIQLF